MNLRTTTALVAIALVGACGPDFSPEGLGTDINFDPDRPTTRPEETAPPYSGSDPYVTQAQQRYRTGLDVQQKVIHRTCTPNDGVCHNRKEYPDLHTPANFVEAIDAPCNMQPGDFRSVWDRCEPRGDLMRVEGLDQANEVAWIEMIEGEAEAEYSDDNRPTESSPGLHIVLRDALPGDFDSRRSSARFTRDFDGEATVFARFRTRWWKVGERRLLGEVSQNQSDEASRLVKAGIRQGDHNRNGVFGLELGPNIPLIKPGAPEESYLIARIRGAMGDEAIPGSRMPLANQPLDIVDMLALYCFVEGLQPGVEANLADAIDYNACSYSNDPENLNLLGEGVTWATRVSKVLQANCGGCHGPVAPYEGFDVISEGAFERLMLPSTQLPEMPLITPGDPMQSYLWLKLTADDGIVGDPMPLGPLGDGFRRLSEAELGDIETWIVNGAIENE